MTPEKTLDNREITDSNIAARLDHIDTMIHEMQHDVTYILDFIGKWSPMVEKFSNPLGGFLKKKP